MLFKNPLLLETGVATQCLWCCSDTGTSLFGTASGAGESRVPPNGVSSKARLAWTHSGAPWGTPQQERHAQCWQWDRAGSACPCESLSPLQRWPGAGSLPCL